ncbi:serine hydrolase, partial [Aerococcus sp. L_32]
MSKRRKKSSIKPLVPFFVLGVALIAVLIAIFKYNDEDKGEADESLTATVDDSSAVESANNIALSLSDEEVYNIDLMQANGVAMIDPISYDSMADVIEDTMVEFGVDESQISLEFINYQTGESYTVNENNFQTAASTIKLPLSVIYVDAIDEGTIDWDTEVTYTYADYEEGDGT